jgi:hypothetical protein
MRRFYREYHASRELVSEAYKKDANAFYALLMAACREAGSDELEKLESCFPEVVKELRQRYSAPGGLLPEERWQGKMGESFPAKEEEAQTT